MLMHYLEVQMRKNYFAKLVNYKKNVYHIENGIKNLKDGRVNPEYKTSQTVLPVQSWGIAGIFQIFTFVNIYIYN